MPGPQPLPSETKKMRGTFRPHRDGPVDHEMDKIPSANVKKPEDLTGEAGRLWDMLIPAMNKAKIIRDPDVPIAAGMCRWFALWRELDQRLQVEAFDLSDIEGERHAALVQRRASDAWKNFCVAAGKLGFSPSDRAKIRSTGDGGSPPSDPLSYFGISTN